MAHPSLLPDKGAAFVLVVVSIVADFLVAIWAHSQGGVPLAAFFVVILLVAEFLVIKNVTGVFGGSENIFDVADLLNVFSR